MSDVEKLEAENASLKSANENLIAEIESLKSELAEKNSPCTNCESISAENASLKLAMAEMKGTQISVSTEVKKPEIPSEPVTIGKKKYMWCVPAFRGQGGEIISAEAASTDPELLNSIVKIEGQGLLKELV